MQWVVRPGQAADRGVHSVGADQQVVVRRAAVTEHGFERVAADLRQVWPRVCPSVAIHRALAHEALLEAALAPVRMGTGLAGLSAAGDPGQPALYRPSGAEPAAIGHGPD